MGDHGFQICLTPLDGILVVFGTAEKQDIFQLVKLYQMIHYLLHGTIVIGNYVKALCRSCLILQDGTGNMGKFLQVLHFVINTLRNIHITKG